MRRLLLNDNFILFLIILNSIVIFLLGFDWEHRYYLTVLDHSLSTIFILEIISKLRVYGSKQYFSENWNVFDFILVMISIPSLFIFAFNMDFIDVSFLLVFRVLRAFKVFRFFKFIKDIDKLIAGIKRALKASVLILVSFILYIFIIGILSHSIFHHAEEFNNPLLSMYNILKIFTLEGWYEIPDALVIGMSPIKSFFTKLYFIIVLVSGGIIGLSLVNSIFVDSMVSDNNDELEMKIDNMQETLNYLKEKLDK